MSNRATRDFFSQINAVYDNVSFTMELETNGSMPFLDVCWILRIWCCIRKSNISKAHAYKQGQI